MFGSSPLARGLRLDTDAVGVRMRIIPARAGFTARHRCGWRAYADHPRSRGVYAWPLELFTLCDGSSPLARGLLKGINVQRARNRIIPARAGFT